MCQDADMLILHVIDWIWQLFVQVVAVNVAEIMYSIFCSLTAQNIVGAT